ncbi:MAG: FTR1 family iron permease [Endomicrobium sp.]|jgi:high-affinity iron transporter|nr:FTR1 family iron permease [Endomicrobium sp.]
MYKLFRVAVLSFALLFSIANTAFCGHETWNQVVDEMSAIADEAYNKYAAGDKKASKASVDHAYFGYYEKLGFEKTVMAYISGERAAKVEYQFSFIKKAINAGKPKQEVKAALDKLVSFLREDANALDGKKESAAGVFGASFLIIAREGFEAIIIVGAIIAYLRRSGNKDKTRAVYGGALIALGASVVMAFILNRLSSLSGANQEIVEGVTMLIAVLVLFYVSNWMVSKAGADAWGDYIKSKVQGSITKGGLFSLAFAAFLAVFREGAETILFYQALIANTSVYFNMVWAGLAAGCVALVIIYILINFLSIKLPLKPFFLGTSVLLFIMSISFTGSGIKELQEGNVISVTPVSWIRSVDILGIYPTLETLIPQLFLLALTIVLFAVHIRKMKKTQKIAVKTA